MIKAVAFTPDGDRRRRLRPNARAPAGGGVEQDMARTWADTATTLRQLAEMVPNLAERAIAIAVTAQGDGTWLIDGAGEPVAPAWLWLDFGRGRIAEELYGVANYPPIMRGPAPARTPSNSIHLA